VKNSQRTRQVALNPRKRVETCKTDILSSFCWALRSKACCSGTDPTDPRADRSLWLDSSAATASQKSHRHQVELTLSVNAHTDARGRRRRFNVGRVPVLNKPPASARSTPGSADSRGAGRPPTMSASILRQQGHCKQVIQRRSEPDLP
jgi:hypothetical protein